MARWARWDERERERERDREREGLKVGRSEGSRTIWTAVVGTAMLGTKMEAAALLQTPPHHPHKREDARFHSSLCRGTRGESLNGEIPRAHTDPEANLKLVRADPNLEGLHSLLRPKLNRKTSKGF